MRPKKVLMALPVGLLAEIDFIAHEKHYTRSELIRDSLRDTVETYRKTVREYITPITIGEPITNEA